MKLPYPPPRKEKTGKRCQFRLPGRRYDCRRVGCYVLSGRCYCAAHYDTAWMVENPEYGQQHKWHIRRNHITGEYYPYETCAVCGAIKVHQGLPQSPCDGKQPRITLR